MSESISSNTMGTATTTASRLIGESGQSTRARRFINKKKRNPKPRPFMGAQEGMQGHIYDIERPGKPCEFIITTEYVRDYMYCTYENAKLLEEIMTV